MGSEGSGYSQSGTLKSSPYATTPAHGPSRQPIRYGPCLDGDARLSRRAVDLIGDGGNELLWSLAGSWEIAIKIGVGKLDLGRPVHRFFADLVNEQNMETLKIGHDHCVQLASLPLHHRDPFDRMLVAQAQTEDVAILTADPKISLYDVGVIF